MVCIIGVMVSMNGLQTGHVTRPVNPEFEPGMSPRMSVETTLASPYTQWFGSHLKGMPLERVIPVTCKRTYTCNWKQCNVQSDTLTIDGQLVSHRYCHDVDKRMASHLLVSWSWRTNRTKSWPFQAEWHFRWVFQALKISILGMIGRPVCNLPTSITRQWKGHCQRGSPAWEEVLTSVAVTRWCHLVSQPLSRRCAGKWQGK